MKKLRLFFLLLCPTCWTFAQGVQTPLMTTVLPGLNASWPGECGPSALDNQSLASRQNIYHSVAAQGAGSWTVTLQYSNTSCTGPWTTYSSINQGSSPAIAVGLDSPFAPAKFIKVAITGAAIATYTGERGLFLNPGSGSSVTFPITIAQGGTNATSVIGALANLDITVVMAAAYNWTPQTPAASLIAGGVNQHIPLTSSPPGVAGANTAYWVYITDATSGSEPVLVTGGTCTSGGGACYLTGTPTYNHTSGQWTVGPGNAGASEAAVANPAGTLVQAPCTALTWHTPMLAPTNAAANAATKFIGCGRESTLITIAADYPVAQPVFQSSGYLAGSGVQPGPDFEDFQVFFPQPDSTTLASYYHWTAFGMSNTPRFEIHNVTLDLPWVGVLAGSSANETNSGGAIIDGLWESSMNTGISFNGALDTVRINNWHHWPFGVTSNQQTAFFNTAVWGGQFGRVDDLDISNSLTISGSGYNFYAGSDGAPSRAKMTNIDFDSWAGLTVSAGTVTCTSCMFTVATETAITQTGGMLMISDSLILGNSAVNPLIVVAPAINSNTTNTIISNNTFILSNPTVGAVPIITVTSAVGNVENFSLNGNFFYLPQFTSFTNPRITVTNGGQAATANIIGNSGMNGTTGAAWLSLTNDEGHVVWGNNFPGWSLIPPSTVTNSLIQDQTVIYTPLKLTPTHESPVTLANPSGQNDNIPVAGLTYVWLQGASGPFSVSGFSGGVDGQIITVENPNGFDWTILFNTGSSAGNMIFSSSISLTIPSTGSKTFATFAYDASFGGWVLVSTSPTTAGTFTPAGVSYSLSRTVVGSCTLGTNCAVTFSPAWSGSTSYFCAATDQTAAAAVKVVNTSNAVATFTGTGTDVISFICVGN